MKFRAESSLNTECQFGDYNILLKWACSCHVQGLYVETNKMVSAEDQDRGSPNALRFELRRNPEGGTFYDW